MLPAESLKFLSEQAKQVGPRIITCDREPAHVYYVVGADGNLVRKTADEPPGRHVALSVETLCRVALASVSDDETASPPAVWYTRDGVVVVLNTETEYPPTCTLPLSPSPQMAMLQRWDKAGAGDLTQAEFVILLRTLFAGRAPDSLLPAVRNVRSQKGSDVNSQIAQGKVSMAKSVVAEMTGVSAIPERVTLTVPVFAQAAVDVSGRVAVEIDPDPQSEKFRLVVHPGAIENAFGMAEEVLAGRIRQALGESAIPVYHGRP